MMYQRVRMNERRISCDVTWDNCYHVWLLGIYRLIRTIQLYETRLDGVRVKKARIFARSHQHHPSIGQGSKAHLCEDGSLGTTQEIAFRMSDVS